MHSSAEVCVARVIRKDGWMEAPVKDEDAEESSM